MLMDHMRRRSDSDFARFRMALARSGQEHVINRHLTTRVVDIPVGGSGSAVQPTPDVPAYARHPDDAARKEVEPFVAAGEKTNVKERSSQVAEQVSGIVSNVY